LVLGEDDMKLRSSQDKRPWLGEELYSQ